MEGLKKMTNNELRNIFNIAQGIATSHIGEWMDDHNEVEENEGWQLAKEELLESLESGDEKFDLIGIWPEEEPEAFNRKKAEIVKFINNDFAGVSFYA